MAATDPDASGGLGSYAKDLRDILTGGLTAIAAPALSKAFGLNDVRYDVNAAGQFVPAAAPSKREPTLLENPVVLVGGALVGVLLVVLIVRKL